MNKKIQKEHKVKILKQNLHQIPSPYSPTCFIATIAYGSRIYSKLNYFREFRDKFLARTKLGSKIINLYYFVSPRLVNFIRNKKTLKLILRFTVIQPLLLFLVYCLSE
jgi:hypothetical protein